MATIVALLAEGVDRNMDAIHGKYANEKSPSSRRAWIEMKGWESEESIIEVALLAEGVDRNMIDRKNIIINPDVALLAEGVDRNGK